MAHILPSNGMYKKPVLAVIKAKLLIWLALSSLQALTFNEPALGRLHYLPLVYTKEGARNIVDYNDYIPVIISGENPKEIYQPTYIFIPTIQRSPVTITDFKNKTRELESSFTSSISMRHDDQVEMEVFVKTPSTSLRGICILTESAKDGLSRITGFKVGPTNALVANRFTVRVGSFPENYKSGNSVSMGFLFF